jgi:hypothetical protein
MFSDARADLKRGRFRSTGGHMSDPARASGAAPSAGWRRCSSCKSPIGFGATYWVCSVSTCNHKRTGLAFCTVSCWDAHLPVARHREAWAEERIAPAQAASGDATAKQRRIVRPSAAIAAAAPAGEDVLIIASRLKDYVRAKSGYNTSDRVLGPLSEIVRRVCDQAIRSAQREGRRTVLDRDIPEN